MRLIGSRRRIAALAVSIVTAFAAPAGADWSEPFTVSPAGRYPRVGVDVAGNALFMWLHSDGANWLVRTRSRSVMGALGSVQRVSPAGEDVMFPEDATWDAGGPQIAMNASGNAVFVWDPVALADDSVLGRARSATGMLRAIQTISAPGPEGIPEVGIDTAGNAVFVWRGSDGTHGRIQARARSASGSLGPVQAISASGQHGFSPRVAVNGAGAVVLVWERGPGGLMNMRIEARSRSAAGVLGPVQTVSAVGALRPRVAIHADGRSVITWQQFDGTHWRALARARSAAGVLGPVLTLSAAGQHAARPRVAMDADGNAVFTWLRSDGTNERVQARARSAAGALSAVQTLSAPGQHASDARVAVAASGMAVFTWQRSDGTNARVQARTRSRTGVLGSVETLSPAGDDAYVPRLAMNADGDAVVVYETDAGVRAHVGP